MDYPKLGDFEGKDFDYVIVGGGTSGCVLANKLVLAGFSVLVVERGPRGEVKDQDVPGNFLKMLDSELNWQYRTTPQVGLNNRVLDGHRGTGIGGGSRLNYMSWVRGPKADFDDWAKLVGDESWSWDNVLPHFKEMETLEEYVAEELREYVQYDRANHGYDGPINVGTGKEALPGASDFIKACMQAGIPLNTDHNSGNPIGVSVAQLNCPNAVRISSARAYLSEEFQKQHASQLSILCGAMCSRILFDANKAIGVEIFDVKNPDEKISVLARQEIILTAGTYGSPHVLLLSGVGERAQLEEFGIPVVADVPGVGQGLQDHAIFSCEYLQDSAIPSYNHFLQDPKMMQPAIDEYESKKTGPLVKYGGAASIACPILDRLFTRFPESTNKT
ncbi:hypothetical protein BP6252_02547 [Coleophoma cylindrospora]|uniref:Glucose-methanol-choline oxidoreductase N-terminal domain-containing protein n=1 Tax=Coleophoma cylindrospora TaxID=1849047 RepID=A0A3D8SF39_9HELO|nr:hypothetical protein BP6252_02547 [Coleophoma cylindrospora]